MIYRMQYSDVLCTVELCLVSSTEMYRSRLKKAPGSGFHPRDESDKIEGGFMGSFGAIKR